MSDLQPLFPDKQVIDGFVPATGTGSFEHVPFQVPPGTARIDVSYSYSAMIGAQQHLAGGNCVDLGVFDAHGITYLDAGFRGWSGSERTAFFISQTDATPGYLAGPLQPGTWHVFLGFYKVGPMGCQYSITVRCTPGNVAVAAPQQPFLMLDNTPRSEVSRPTGWYRGELHCHTTYSDGTSSPAEVVATAREQGLDFLAITDHNTTSHLRALHTLAPHDLLMIPGIEVTTFRGHWNVWGLSEWVDFRGVEPSQMRAAMEWARSRGGLISCNHPKPFGPPWENTTVEDYDCVEICNGPWPTNEVALAFWDAQLRRGRRVTAVGGSDMHRLTGHRHHLGEPTNWVYCRHGATPAAILAGIKAGHVVISIAPTGPTMTLHGSINGGTRVMMGDQLVVPAGGHVTLECTVSFANGSALEVWTADGCISSVAVTGHDFAHTADYTLDGSPYVRLQVVDDADHTVVQAVSNPIYLSSA
ncbi:MAG: CehA/McbA family metallohydrolase [Herpetosiphon sp.]